MAYEKINAKLLCLLEPAYMGAETTSKATIIHKFHKKTHRFKMVYILTSHVEIN